MAKFILVTGEAGCGKSAVMDYLKSKGKIIYKTDDVVKELTEKGLLTESEGAKIVDLSEYDMAPCLILKKDGSSIYATRDIAAVEYRKKTYNFEKCLYVTYICSFYRICNSFNATNSI